ncbi:MAG: hypothetical protein ACXWNE_09985 [Candidatus Binataceae bacterium]
MRSAVAKVTAAGKLDSKAEWELGKAIERAYFFFGDDAMKYLKALQDDVGELSILEAERSALSNPTDLKTNVESARKAKDRVFAFYRDGQPIFARYMRFDQRL